MTMSLCLLSLAVFEGQAVQSLQRSGMYLAARNRTINSSVVASRLVAFGTRESGHAPQMTSWLHRAAPSVVAIIAATCQRMHRTRIHEITMACARLKSFQVGYELS